MINLLIYFWLMIVQPTADQYLIAEMCFPVEGCKTYNLHKEEYKYISYNTITHQLYLKLDDGSGILVFDVDTVLDVDGRKTYYFCNNEGMLSIAPFIKSISKYDSTMTARAILEVRLNGKTVTFVLSVVKLVNS